MRRREARRLVLQSLYQREFLDISDSELLDEVDLGDQESYIRLTLSGISKHLQTIDTMIAAKAEGWKVERLALIDRNILRLGIFEIMYCNEIPAEVTIDEAVELAKEYGSDNAPSFINGILDRLWKENSPIVREDCTKKNFLPTRLENDKQREER
ncbi:transcription antitermination factor NusB [Candidatus Acetothermia bacterium]|jgi:N utilization substance protein B|nr:transcription antitermination factor NusB [Candidatus Acetothermia bacterium]MCI2426588.1 transcription antitermination factor NusB [Candidatus Acetothermia bacterium]MCI2427452.1 transcription antitermination factor NusB [Candidatus Acetothermia bacterium]MCI2428575.1 transcription antitermination factor NusB [Candidatus Acetothermia bacterium]